MFDEIKATKEDWDFILNLKKLKLSEAENDQRFADYFTPKLGAINNSKELVDSEKEENLLTYEEYLRVIQHGRAK